MVSIVEPVETQPEPIPEPPPEPPPEPDPDPAPQQPPIETSQTNQPNQPNQPNTLLLRRQTLATARDLDPEAKDPNEANPLAPASIPELPGTSGWIDEYIGTVSARVDHWQANDGSRSTRIVLPSGQIVCGRAQAPTSAEMFNPSFALNMMFWKECGRQRPEPADRSDPWLRAPRRTP